MAGILGTRELTWPDEAGCAACAARLARCAALREAFVALEGPLGAGKTTFVRHLLRALGVSGRIKSPTYAVLEPHEAPGLSISHLDFYRFGDPREWEDAGLRDVFAQPGLKLAEWPERVRGVLPTPDLRLHIEPLGEGPNPTPDAHDAHARDEPPAQRQVHAEALTPRGLVLLEALAPGGAQGLPDAA
jgi:tRNA threonylcarbamoyladenosine biosynthesis protein TsaE